MTYADYLKGKTVALVGPANYLQGQGEIIDSHDVVVRVNHVYPIPKRYGTRTDVLYHGVWKAFRNRGTWAKGELREIEKRVKWIVFRNSTWQRKSVKRAAQPLKTSWAVIEPEYHLYFRRILPDGKVNTGTAALIHLLSFDIKYLSVYGFDFYRSGVFRGYGDPLEEQAPRERGKNSHDTEGQIKFLAELKDERFRPDEVLEGILNDSSYTSKGWLKRNTR